MPPRLKLCKAGHVSASITLASFARNPRKALRRLPATGLVLTRPGEPALRITLDSSPASPVSQPPQAVTPEAGAQEAAAASQPQSETQAQPENETQTETHEADVATCDIARAALALLTRDQFVALVSKRNPWLDTLPPAVLRMVLDEVESARISSGASMKAVDEVLRHWQERSAAFTR